MQIIRTIIWVLLLVALLLFSAVNWDDVKVVLWPNSDPAQTIVADTKIPVLVLLSFLIGFLPMWLYHRASKWGMTRKIANLENAARTQANTPVAPPSPPAPEAEAAPPPPPPPPPASEPAASEERSELGPLTPPDEDSGKA
ncbi:LapA family protein [Aurantiacibacter gilvus]|uniref:LapA family protein n=1 Tax=Aurantiacibacter gilvus TaxID=3139141 RepID=A0ABU9IEG9_9SPHN